MAATIVFNIDARKLQKGLKKTEASFNKTAISLKKKAEKLRSGLFVATAQFTGMALAIGSVVKAAADIEAVTTQFEVLTGSAELAAEVIEELKEFSASTPFQFKDIADAGKTMIAFGETTANLSERLRKIGDVASSVGQPIGEVAKIFGQVKSEGKLMGERLMQLQERAIPIGPAIESVFKDLGRESELTGVSIKELGSKGKITFEIFEKAFDKLSQEGGPAFEGMIKQSKTMSGLISTLKDNWSLLLIEIGEKFLPEFKVMAIKVTEFLKYLKGNKSLLNFAVAAATVTTAFLGLKLATIALGSQALFLGGAFFKAGAALVAFAKVKVGVIAALNGIRLATGALMGSTGIGLIIWFLPEITKVFKIFWNNASEATSIAVGTIKGMLSGLANVFKEAFSPGDNWGERISQAFSNVMDIYRKGKADFIALETKEEEEEEKARIERENARLEAKKARDQENEDEKKITDEQKKEAEDKARREEEVKELERLDLYSSELFERDKSTRKKWKGDFKKFSSEKVKLQEMLHKLETDKENQHYIATKIMADSFASLQEQSNKTLSDIGKVGAHAQRAIALTEMGIATYNAASQAYMALSAIPFVGPVLGAAAAALIVMTGLRQMDQVRRARHGGIVDRIPGSPSMGDYQPFLLEPGEMITPGEDVALVREASEKTLREDGETGGMGIQIGIDSDASSFIFARKIENQALGIGVV